MDGPRSDLSVCLIVRDEERSLPRALASVRDVADEICVLDTGSQDGTREVAHSFGAKVGEFAWGNDFAAARNASLELASRSWVLALDADEELAQATIPELRAALLSERLAWLVAREDLKPHGQPPETIRLARLFRNDPRIRYARPVHEDISDSLFAAGVRSLDDSGVRLTHYGYLPEMLAERDKLGRNVAILRQRVQSVPGDIFSLHKLAQSLGRAEDASERLTVFGAAFEAAEQLSPAERDELPHVPEIYDGFAAHLADQGRLSDAFRVIRRGLEQYPDRQELLFRRGDLARRVGDVVLAQESFRMSLGRCRVSTLKSSSRTVAVRSLLGLASIALDADLLDDAAHFVGLALALAPNDLAVRRLDLEVQLATQQLANVAQRLGELLDRTPYDAGVKVIGGRLAWMSRAPEVAREIWRSALGPHEDGDLARLWLWLADGALGAGLADVSPLRVIVPRDTRTAAAHAIADALTEPGPPLDAMFRTAAVERRAVAFLGELGRYGPRLEVHATSAPDPAPLSLSSLFPPAAE